MSITSVNVVKKKTASQVKLERIFPKNNLDTITETTTISVADFIRLWNNTGGYHNGGNQYSNMDSWDYCVATKTEKLNKFYQLDALATTITKQSSAGWSIYHTRSHGYREHKVEKDILPNDFEIVYRKRYKYRDPKMDRFFPKSGQFIIARKSKCGKFVTVFKDCYWK